MNCTFYRNTSVKDKINKELTVLESRKIVFLTRENALKPIIKLSNIPPLANYCYIDELERYYFVDDMSVDNNNIYTVYLSIDVLMTYRNQIMSNKAKIVQSENVLNADKTDYVPMHKEETTIFDFPNNPFESEKTDVLICVRG